MKILAAGDMHGNEHVAEKLAEEAEKNGAELVLIAGDIADFGEIAKGMIGPFLKRGKKVAFITGNHETPGLGEFLSEKYKIPNIQSYAFIYRDIGVFGCGGANIGMGFVSDEDMFRYLKNGFKYIKNAKKKIMVTHVHPKGSIIERTSFPGSEAVTKAIYEFKPDLHICGHIHEMEGFEEKMGGTPVICVGSRGKIVDV